jgi:hypothetical protein
MMNPDFEKEFILQTDSSKFWLGQCFSLLDDEGNERQLHITVGSYYPWNRNMQKLNKSA